MFSIEYLRSFRIGPFAVFDFVASYLFVFLVAPLIIKAFSKIKVKISRTQLLWLTVPISILIHIAVRQITPLTQMFIEPWDHYLVKTIIVFMVYMGLRKPKK